MSSKRLSPEKASPIVFDFGDPVAGVVERLAAAGGGKDQLLAPVGGIGAALLEAVMGQPEPETLMWTMWATRAAHAAARRLRHGTMAILPGAGHVGPLLQATPTVADLITAFWREPNITITTQQATPAGASG